MVLSRKELRQLFKTPQRLKQKVLLRLIYSAGLRVSEVCKLKLTDIDDDKSSFTSANDRSHYVILSNLITRGLAQYILEAGCLMSTSMKA
jgi:integrase/recombinase XerD